MKSNQPTQEDTNRSTFKNVSDHYEILVQGQLDTSWGQWFEGMKLLDAENGESGVACTLIAGQVADQSALHGLLIKIRDLNLKLISVRRVKSDRNLREEIKIEPENE